MPDERHHTLRLSDLDVGAIERSLRTRSVVLSLTGTMRATEQIKDEAHLLAHVAAILQEHARPNCDCTPPDVPPPRPGLMPIHERRVI